MRPIELTLDGFRSYATATTFGWEGRRLVGIVGPIGSGKSTILDGIAFALYGKTPRVERDVRSLINQRREEGKVSLTFEVDGQQWRAVRALRRKGASAHALYRVVDGSAVEEVDRAREMNDRVTELLGLDWDAFRRSILLAQNQFAGFLEATATQRNEVLKGVFAFEDLDAMREVVRTWLDAATMELTRLATLRQQAARDRADLEAAHPDHVRAGQRLEGLRAIADEVGRAEAARADLETAAAAATERRAALTELADRLPGKQEVDGLIAKAAAGDAGLASADQGLASAQEALDEARATLGRKVEDAGGREVLDEAARLIAQLEGETRASEKAADQAQQARREAAQADDEVRSAEEALEVALGQSVGVEDALEAAKAALAEARDRLHDARHQSMAAALRAELREGEPCPVCDRPVDVIPRGELPDSLRNAEAAVAATEQAEAEARDRAMEASAVLVGAKIRLEEARRAAERTTQKAIDTAGDAEAAAGAVIAARERLGGLLGEGEPAQRLDERRVAIEGAERAVAAADELLAAARRARDEAAGTAEAAREELSSVATHVAAIAGRLALDVEIRGHPASLDAALRRVREAWVEANQAVEQAISEAGSRSEEAMQTRAALMEGVGLDPAADFRSALTEADGDLARIGARVEVLEARLEDLAELEEKESGTVRRHATLERLHADLAPSKLQSFVMDEYRRALADLGSELFEVLSGGRYRFSGDGAFDVVDLMAAEQTRAVDSLSGGETFLASLALALALAEIVARRGGRLDAFFLDEGFGSLDAEHLDLAMEGVERLVSGADRLVVVVSHVGALRDRIEDLIELDKDPLTGVTRVLSGADR